MPKVCEVCGNEEQIEDVDMDELRLHVCENCIKDRRPVEDQLR